MNTVALSSFMVLLTIVSGITVANTAFADHSSASVSIPAGTSVPGCETTNECWIPNEVTVDVGGEVTWSNDDTAAHTVTAGTAADGLSGEFDSSLFMAGTTFSHKFESAGSFPYFCMVHPWMEGMVIVQEAGAEEPKKEEPTMSGTASATGMLTDQTMVSITASKATAGEKMKISIEFKGKEHVNYDMKVTQAGKEVLNDMGAHSHDGKGTHETAPLASADPVDITVQFNGYGVDKPYTGEPGKVVFSKIVPEFGTIAMMILVVSIISIVAITAKTRVIPRF